MLEIRGVSKLFGGFQALNGVSLDVARGEILGLIGPNGSGKTTLFNVVAGALTPSAGSIRFQGREITGLTPDRVCALGIGRTFQIPRPFRKLSILENVTLAAYFAHAGTVSAARAREQARETLDLVGLAVDAAAKPSVLGAGGLKKLELARALATRPTLLLADESLGGLDPDEMRQAAETLQRIRHERAITIIWVEHIMATLMPVVDRVMVLDHGEKTAGGRPRATPGDPKSTQA